MSLVNLLAEGKISPYIDVYVVYKCLFRGERPPREHEPYCNRDMFLSLTYVTPAMRQYLEDFLRKLARGESEVYVLPAALGAGKSHFLALVLHILRLYKDCRSKGSCVKGVLERFGIDLATPDIVEPEVYVFSGLYDVKEWLLNVTDKETYRKLLSKAPHVVIFDETQMFELKDEHFPYRIQMLSEAVREVGGSFLFASFALFPGASDRPDLKGGRTLDVLNRVSPRVVGLDTVKNIVEVFRRWAGVTLRHVDLSSLKSAVSDRAFQEFERELGEAYPFNPKFLRSVLELADESLIGRTRVQLTRGLLRTLATAYVRAGEGKLVTYAHLENLSDLLIPGDIFAEFWQSLFKQYEADLRRISGTEWEGVGGCVLRYVLISTFLGRLLPQRTLYPSEEDLKLGCFDGADLRPFDVGRFLQVVRDLGLHIDRLDGRFVYWYLGDEREVVKRAMVQFSDLDGLDVAVGEVVALVERYARRFSAVYVSGRGTANSQRVKIVETREEWEKRLAAKDETIMAVDLIGFGVKERRNNLLVFIADDSREISASGNLLYFDPSARTARRAVETLGKAIRAIEEIIQTPHYYIRDLPEEDTPLAKEMVELMKSRLRYLEGRVRSELKYVVSKWIAKAIMGHMEKPVESFEDVIREFVERDHLRIVKSVVESGLVEWSGFKRVGDLWSMYLNRKDFPPAAISYSGFYESLVKEYCKGCQCVFRRGDEVFWLDADGQCRPPEEDENLEVAPVFLNGRLVEWAVEEFLKYLAGRSSGGRIFGVEYRRPSGEVVRRRADELLGDRGEWIYLVSNAKLYEERVEKFFDVKIDGVATAEIEKRHGEKTRVRIDASHDIESVTYIIGGEHRRIAASGSTAEFEFSAPQRPGEHPVDVEVRFRDGSVARRRILVKVAGLCRKEVIESSISTEDYVASIETQSVDDALHILNALSDSSVEFKFRVEAKYSGGEGVLDVKVDFSVREKRERDNLRRLLMSIKHFTPYVYAVFEVGGRLSEEVVSKLRSVRARYRVLREQVC